MKTLETGVANSSDNFFLSTMTISADGEYGAYLIRDESGERLTTFVVADPALATFQMIDQRKASEMILSPLAQVVDYHNDEATALIVSTSQGVYSVDYATGEQNTLFEIDSEAGTDATFYAFESLSPDRRYYLVQGFFFEAANYFVIDMHSGERIIVPEASSYVNRAGAAWNIDGELTTVVQNDQIEELGFQETVYEIVAVDGGFELKQIGERIIPMGDTALVDYGAQVSLAPGSQAFFPTFVTNVNEPGLWRTFEGVGQVITRLPAAADLGQVLWMPDGEGALIWLDGGALYGGETEYLSAARDVTIPLSTILGLNIDDFHWTVP